MGLILVGGLLAVQVLLVWGYLAAEERRIIKRSDLFGYLLAALLLATWIGFVVISRSFFPDVE